MKPTPEDDLIILQGVTKRFLKWMDKIIANEINETTSIVDFAERIKIKRPTLYKYRDGKQNVTIPQVVRLCKLYGIDTNEVLLGKKNPNKIKG